MNKFIYIYIFLSVPFLPNSVSFSFTELSIINRSKRFRFRFRFRFRWLFVFLDYCTTSTISTETGFLLIYFVDLQIFCSNANWYITGIISPITIFETVCITLDSRINFLIVIEKKIRNSIVIYIG